MVYSASVENSSAQLDAVFAALAHPARRDLVVYLAGRPTAPRMSDVAIERGLSPQLLNKHTAALEKAGLVRRTGAGRARYLVLDAAAMTAAQDWMHKTRVFWQQRFDSLDSYISALKEET